MLDLICVGEMLIDFLPGEQEGVYVRKAGGAPANVAIAAARNNLRVGFCGRVGDDDFGRFLFSTLRDNNVEVLCPEPVKQAVTTMAFVTLKENGERSFTFARKPGADMLLTDADVNACGVRDARILHAGSCSLSQPPASEATAYAMRVCAKLGRLISFDVNYRDLLWDGNRAAARRAVTGALNDVDLLKISEEELDFVGGEQNIPRLMRQHGISAVVLTMGAQGSRCYWKDTVLFVPGIPVDAVDTTGAGDAFWGAFLSHLVLSGVESPAQLSHTLLQAAMERGNIAGHICVQRKGAIESLPTRAQIDALKQKLSR